ncbi:MAG: apolipoprotein acyltransferase [Paracoccaceae bacterium]
MIVVGAAIIGAIIGGMTAARRKGSRLDIAQYAGSFAIAFATLGLIATVLIHRAMV